MIRGFVYSLLGIIVFLSLCVIWFIIQKDKITDMTVMGGWLLLISLFAVGPLFFVMGYLHHIRKHPQALRWDPETGE